MEYYVNFENDTDRVWTMGVYQKFPDSVGFDSVSWKQSTAPPGGRTGVDWEIIVAIRLDGDHPPELLCGSLVRPK